MASTLLLLFLATLAAAGVIGTLVLVSRDGYRRIPTRPTTPRVTARTPRREGGASAGDAHVDPGVSATFAPATAATPAPRGQRVRRARARRDAASSRDADSVQVKRAMCSRPAATSSARAASSSSERTAAAKAPGSRAGT